ncbi:MAG TPA: hypothetical protein VGX50_11645, partial [Longimicrobium sp.]|nr:hypothetical protein [Longimicrobium sp.]
MTLLTLCEADLEELVYLFAALETTRRPLRIPRPLSILSNLPGGEIDPHPLVPVRPAARHRH